MFRQAQYIFHFFWGNLVTLATENLERFSRKLQCACGKKNI